MKYLRFQTMPFLTLFIALLVILQLPALEAFAGTKKTKLTFIMEDGQKLRGHLERPVGAGAFPAVIFLHGSGGMGLYYKDMIQYLARNGFVGLAYARRSFPYGGGRPDRKIRYRDYIFKDVRDLDSVINRLRELPHIGNSPICVMGRSEGGQIAYLAASQIRGLKAVIGLNGVTDYLDWYDWAVTEYPKFPISKFKYAAKNVVKIFGCSPKECIDRYKALSPIHQVDEINCTIMIVHGEKDPQVPVRQAYRFAEALKERDKPYELHVYPNEGHFQSFFSNPDFGTGEGSSWLNSQVWTRKSSQDLLGKVMVFLNEYLK